MSRENFKKDRDKISLTSSTEALLFVILFLCTIVGNWERSKTGDDINTLINFTTYNVLMFTCLINLFCVVENVYKQLLVKCCTP